MRKLLLAAILFCACQKPKTGHDCAYSLCPFKGQLEFKAGCGACEPFTDCWCIDALHFENPKLDYDQLEQLLFKP